MKIDTISKSNFGTLKIGNNLQNLIKYAQKDCITGRDFRRYDKIVSDLTSLPVDTLETTLKTPKTFWGKWFGCDEEIINIDNLQIRYSHLSDVSELTFLDRLIYVHTAIMNGVSKICK